MANGASTNWAVVKPEVTADDNAWGGHLLEGIDIWDALLGDVETISTTSGTVTLSTAQKQSTGIKLTATLVGNLILDFGTQKGCWFIRNSTSGSFTVTAQCTGAATVATITQGTSAVILSDGTNVYAASGTALSALTASGAMPLTDWASVASATTTDIGAATSNFVLITGTTTITGLGTAAATVWRYVRFAAALTLTYNATSLILPGAASITTAAGDCALFKSEAAGNWRCIFYSKASGLPNIMATAAEYRVGTTTKPIGVDQAWAAMAEVTLTDAATVATDMSLGIDFVLTLGGNRTLGAPTNVKVGQRGRIRIVQDGTGSRTLAYHANWKFAGGTDPTLSTAAGAEDYLDYDCVSATKIRAVLTKAYA